LKEENLGKLRLIGDYESNAERSSDDSYRCGVIDGRSQRRIKF